MNLQCRDFDTILQWREENSIDIEKWRNMVKPEGVREVEVEAGYWELFGEGDGVSIQWHLRLDLEASFGCTGHHKMVCIQPAHPCMDILVVV